MKKKTGIYLVIGIVGIALALSARFLLQDCLSDSQSGAMIGIGAGLFRLWDCEMVRRSVGRKKSRFDENQ